MDAVEAMSSMESKADRIARYKAERRRELAERYANMEDLTSKYTRRERNKDPAPEAGEKEARKPPSHFLSYLIAY